MPTTRQSGSAELVPVYILSGGRNRRFGSDKARAPKGGRPLIVTIAESLSTVAQYVRVVGRRDGEYDDLGLETVGDVISGKGPMGGLLTAIEDYGDRGWILVVACDWVGLRPEWVGALLAGRTSTAQAVVYRSDRYEPLFALYRGTIRASLRSRVERGHLALHEFLKDVNAIVVPAPVDWGDAVNLNRPVPSNVSDTGGRTDG